MIFSCALGSARAQELTEWEAVHLFLTASPVSRQLRGEKVVVEAQARSRTVWPNPQVSFEHEGAGLTQLFDVHQPLPVTGRFSLLKRAGVEAVEASGNQAEFVLWNACSDMREVFHELAFALQREGELNSSLTELQEVVHILTAREQQGEGSRFDRLRAEQEVAELQSEIAANHATITALRGGLHTFLAMDIKRAYSAAPVALTQRALPPLVDLLREAGSGRNDVLAALRQQEQLRLETQAAARLRIPEPELFAGLKRAEDTGPIRYGPHIGISVSLPLFDRGQHRLAELRAEQVQATSRQRVIAGQIESEVTGAYREVEARRTAAQEFLSRTGTQTAQLTQIARVSYEEGEAGILELLDVYRLRRQTALRLLELSAAAKLAEIRLERAIGKPAVNTELLP